MVESITDFQIPTDFWKKAKIDLHLIGKKLMLK